MIDQSFVLYLRDGREQEANNHLALETDILWEGVNEGIKDEAKQYIIKFLRSM